MSDDSVSLRGTVVSSSPCTVEDASILLQKFLASDAVSEAGLLRGYLISVSGALEELVSTRAVGQRKSSSKKGTKPGKQTRLTAAVAETVSEAPQEPESRQTVDKKRRFA